MGYLLHIPTLRRCYARERMPTKEILLYWLDSDAIEWIYWNTDPNSSNSFKFSAFMDQNKTSSSIHKHKKMKEEFMWIEED